MSLGCYITLLAVAIGLVWQFPRVGVVGPACTDEGITTCGCEASIVDASSCCCAVRAPVDDRETPRAPTARFDSTSLLAIFQGPVGFIVTHIGVINAVEHAAPEPRARFDGHDAQAVLCVWVI